MKKSMFGAKSIAMYAMLIALNVVFAEVLKFPIIPKVLELSFGFVPIALAGMLFGPLPAVVIAVIADVIGALIFSAGDFFPGFTVTALLEGLFYGLVLQKPAAQWKGRILKAMLAQGLVTIICFMGCNTLWAYIMGYGRTKQFIVTRLTVNVVAYPVYTFVLCILQRYRNVFQMAVK